MPGIRELFSDTYQDTEPAAVRPWDRSRRPPYIRDSRQSRGRCCISATVCPCNSCMTVAKDAS